jgi:hypothetical protein
MDGGRGGQWGWRERRTVGTAGEVDNGIDGGIWDSGKGRVERYVDGGMAALTDRRHFSLVDAPHTFDTESAQWSVCTDLVQTGQIPHFLQTDVVAISKLKNFTNITTREHESTAHVKCSPLPKTQSPYARQVIVESNLKTQDVVKWQYRYQ